MQELDPYLNLGQERMVFNGELGRHRGREGKLECNLCGAEYESMVHVLWECLASSSSSRASFLVSCRYADFELLNSVEKISYVLGSA